MYVVCMIFENRINSVDETPYLVYSDAVARARKLGYRYCGQHGGCWDIPVDGGCVINRNDSKQMAYSVRSLCDVCKG